MILALSGEPDGRRWIFFVNVPIGVIALVLAARLIPKGGGGGRTGRIDVIGIALLGSGVLALLLPLVQAESGGIARLRWLFPVGAVLLVAFWLWERRAATGEHPPLLDVRLLTDIPGYATGAALGLADFVGFSGIWLVFAV